MSFPKKIMLRLAGAIAAFIPLIFFSLFMIHKIIKSERDVIVVNAMRTRMVERLQFYNSALMRQMPVYILSRDPSSLDAFYEFHGLFDKVLAELLSREKDATNLKLLEKIKEKSNKAFTFVVPGIQMLKEGKSAQAVDRFFRENALGPANEAASLTGGLALRSADLQSSAKAKLTESLSDLERGLGLLAFLAVLLSAWAAVLIKKLAEQKQKAEEQTIRISEARKEVIEIVAHDLKNPLTSIGLTLDSMRKGVLRSGMKADFSRQIDLMEASTRSITQLSRDLLDHAQIEAGHFILKKSISELSTIVKNLILRFQLSAQRKGILLEAELSSEKVLSLCDVDRMDQAISNLVSNAIKFTPRGGRVKVTCGHRNGTTFVSVEDTGAGLASDEIPHVFERYWQASKQRSGTGLGLSIVKSIVDAHAGQICVESVQGKGSRFSIALPS